MIRGACIALAAVVLFGACATSPIGARHVDSSMRLAGDPPPVGTALHGTIDWDRRYALMRHHTALHVLCGVIYQLFGALVTGGQMYVDRARMDFALDDLSPERIAEIERVANEKLAESHPIQVRLLPREAALQIPDLIRTQVNLIPPSIAEIRIAHPGVVVHRPARLVLTQIFENTRRMIAAILESSPDEAAIRRAVAAFRSYQVGGLSAFARWLCAEGPGRGDRV